MLEISELSVSYGQHLALDGAKLRVAPGEIVVILGANGAGKSTLLKALSGICEGRVTGTVLLDGQAIDGLAADQIVEEGIALVPEGRGIFADLSVEENLKLGAFPNRASGEEQANLDRVFGLFPKLIERRKQIASTMSGGEQQMVAIGRAMMSSPQILMLDEPSLGLSPLLCKELFQNLKAVRELGIGVLMVEQNAKQSLAIADRGYLLENTRIVHEDSADSLMTDPAVQAAYLGAGSSSVTQPIQSDQTDAQAEMLPVKLSAKPPSRSRISASNLAGVDIDDLVARADVTSKSSLTTGSKPMPEPGNRSSLSHSPSDLSAMLKEFEIAAAKAGKSKPLPTYQPKTVKPKSPDSAPSPAEAEQEKPVTIEIYRAPRVEVYRRRPTGRFERD